MRRLGAVAPLLPVGALALLARLVLLGEHGTGRAVVGLVCSVLAAPALLVMGVPLTTSASATTIAWVLSLALWTALGVGAATRATRRPAVAWREYWVEFAWSGGAVWVGVVMGLVIADVVLGRPLL